MLAIPVVDRRSVTMARSGMSPLWPLGICTSLPNGSYFSRFEQRVWKERRLLLGEPPLGRASYRVDRQLN